MLDIWDEKLSEYAIKICQYRTEFINKLKDKIKIIHKNITENKEEIDLEYITECKDKNEYLNLLKQRRN